MSDIITVKNLSKIYNISHDKKGYKSFRDDLVSFIKNPFSTFFEKKEKFYALKNVSFSLKRGETLGIIGANGAGKSTLLKILSRVTPPSNGEVLLNGKISSLLEVGTGFHPELTGRENIFLSGAVLGMKHIEIKRKFDAIVDFAGVHKFLDTPVKHFSSGMYTRLAFSVAAHLEPDILIVDEVLAVGDAAFQKKCLGKMNEASKEGRTVIFVSHNMTAIADLCKRSILLDSGKIAKIGATREVISAYLSNNFTSNNNGSVDFSKFYIKRTIDKDSTFSFEKITLATKKRKQTNFVLNTEPFLLQIKGQLKKYTIDFFVGITILSNGVYPIYSSQITGKEMKLTQKSKNVTLTLSIDPNIFSPGNYTISLGASGKELLDWIPEAMTFTVENSNNKNKLQSVYDGLVVYPRKWSVKIK